METNTAVDDQWIRNILNKKETKQKKIQEKSPLAVLHGYLSIYLDLFTVLNLFQWKLDDWVL